jgi:hypothetical protein
LCCAWLTDFGTCGALRLTHCAVKSVSVSGIWSARRVKSVAAAEDYVAARVESDEFICGNGIFSAKSLVEFVADRAKDARHKGALSVAPRSWANLVLWGYERRSAEMSSLVDYVLSYADGMRIPLTTLFGSAGMYMFSTYKGFDNSINFLRRMVPDRTDTFYFRFDFILMSCVGTVIGLIAFSPTEIYQALAAGFGWTGALNVLLKAEPPPPPSPPVQNKL